MKKYISIILCLVLMTAAAGCGSTDGASTKTINQTTGVNEVLEQGMSEADNKSDVSSLIETSGVSETPALTEAPAVTAAPADTATAAAGTSDGIDVDLTALSSTMVYSEVFSMISTPENYIGKTVKMDGLFAHYRDQATGNDYFACIIQDATACCAQGIEFILTGDHTYPDNYPELESEICVVGVFDTYKEGEYTYCTLREAQML